PGNLPIPNFGANLNLLSGEIEDNSWAWNSSIGWLNLNPSRPVVNGGLGILLANFPAVATGDNYRSDVYWDKSTDEFRGWAKFNGLPADQGWVRFQPDADDPGTGLWGVNHSGVCSSDKIKIVGNAWSNDFGWIKFNGTAVDGNEYSVKLSSAPIAPILDGLALGSNGCKEVNISWVDQSFDETGFKVSKIIVGQDWDTQSVLVRSIGPSAGVGTILGCLDNSGVPGVNYEYRVMALGVCTNSNWMNAGTVATSSVCNFPSDGGCGVEVCVGGLCPDKVNVSWAAPASGAGANLQYTVQRKIVKDEDGNPVVGNFINASAACVDTLNLNCVDDVGNNEDGLKHYKYRVIVEDTITDDQSISAESLEVVPCPDSPSWKEINPR
ncbi:MAG: hypothetical protein V1698_01775, partial [bacterium]